MTGYPHLHLVVDCLPGDTAGPDHPSIAEVQGLRPSKYAGEAEAALVLLTAVPAEVWNN